MLNLNGIGRFPDALPTSPSLESSPMAMGLSFEPLICAPSLRGLPRDSLLGSFVRARKVRLAERQPRSVTADGLFFLWDSGTATAILSSWKS